MKKIIAILLLTLIILPLFSSAHLSDMVGLMSGSEKEEVLSQLEKSSENSGLALSVVIVNGTGGKSEEAFADDYYDTYIDQDDGVLLLLDYLNRSVYISTTGYGMYAVDDSGEEVVFDSMMGYLQNGEWKNAFLRFALSVEELSREYSYSEYQNTSYDINTGEFTEETKRGFDWALLVISFLVPAIPGGFITIAVMKRKLRSEGLVTNADDYVVPSSFVLDHSRGIYLYSTISKVPRAQNNSGSRGHAGRSSSGHFSSSGRIHGGGGRKF